MPPLPVHLSHAADAADGGIAIALAELIASQHAAGLSPSWLTADRFPPYQRFGRLQAALLAEAAPLVHIHGLWRSPTRLAYRLASTGMPLVIAPHGMLDPGALAISRHKKQIVWHLWERRALRSACCLHALCPAEADAIRRLLPGVPIATIPNGVVLPSSDLSGVALPPPAWSEVIPRGESVLLFLGRFHRKKGIEPLLAAWQTAAAAAERAGWWLALVGYGDGGVLAQRVAAAQSRGELQRLLVLGPVFDAHKASVLEAASAFVLPSFSEGLPMAALEAMAHRLPSLLSGACNLPQAFSVGAALRAEPDPITLAGSLQRFFALSPGERSAMGAAGQALVRDAFSWPHVAEQTRQLYGWIVAGGERPDFVEPG